MFPRMQFREKHCPNKTGNKLDNDYNRSQRLQAFQILFTS